MNQKQAIAKLRAVIGDKFAYRVNHKAPDAEQREALLVELRKAKAAAEEAEAARDARRAEILGNDPLYQQLKAAAAVAVKAKEGAGHGAYSHRIEVGSLGSMFFSIRASGDNWAEVVEKVCTKSKEPA